MLRTSRNFTTAAAAAAGVLGGVAIASAAPGVTLGAAPVGTVQIEDAPEETDPEDDDDLVEDDDLDADLDGDAEDETVDPDADDSTELDADDADDADEGVDADDGDEDVSAFAAWVRSLPSDWGCVRGHVISAHAAGPKDDFEGPAYASIEEAVADLGLEGRCVEVAIARVTGETGHDGDGEVSGSAAEPGPPAHARAPERAADAAGSAGAGRGGPPEGRGGPAAERGGPPEGRGGPPEGRGPR